MPAPERLAQPLLGLGAGAGIGRRHAVRGFVDEADDPLVRGKRVPVDGIVFVGVDDECAVFFFQGSEKSDAVAAPVAAARPAASVAMRKNCRVRPFKGVPRSLTVDPERPWLMKGSPAVYRLRRYPQECADFVGQVVRDLGHRAEMW